MSQFFDTLKAIALSNKPQSAKVKEMQKATGMTAAAARQQIATIVFMNQSASRAERTNNASLRFVVISLSKIKISKAIHNHRLYVHSSLHVVISLSKIKISNLLVAQALL